MGKRENLPGAGILARLAVGGDIWGGGGISLAANTHTATVSLPDGAYPMERVRHGNGCAL